MTQQPPITVPIALSCTRSAVITLPWFVQNPMPTQAEWSAVRAKLAFTCVHEADHLPPLDPQADTLFKYALFLEKKPGPKDFDAAARYYRIAAAYGHYKANHNLQLLVSTGQASSPHAATETIDLAEQLIAAGIPGGYYDIDRIVPLPPAKLPEWDGTFQWQKEQDAAQPPQKPAGALVTKLAREKNLDPATGLPLTPTKKDNRLPLGTTARTNEFCPHDGVWCAKQWAGLSPDATQRIGKGEIMPRLTINQPRAIPGLDALLGMRQHHTDVTWSLVAYSDEA